MNFITPRLLNPQRAPDPEACLWSHLRYAAEPLSITDLVRRTDIDVETVARQLRAWKKDGLIVSIERTGLFQMAKIAAAQDAPPTMRAAKKLPKRFTPRSMRQRRGQPLPRATPDPAGRFLGRREQAPEAGMP